MSSRETTIVTGGAGFIGSHLLETLLALDQQGNLIAGSDGSGLGGVPDPGGGPPELGFHQLEGVFHVAAAQVRPPAHVQVRWLRPGVPQPHGAVRAAAVRQPLATVDIATRRPAVAIKQRTDVCAVPAGGVGGEAVVAFVLVPRVWSCLTGVATVIVLFFWLTRRIFVIESGKIETLETAPLAEMPTVRPRGIES